MPDEASGMSPEYLAGATQTTPTAAKPAIEDTTPVEEVRYGLAKPRRIVTRANLAANKD